MKTQTVFANDDYNALVHDYARISAALGKCSLELPFYSETLTFLLSFAGCAARENGFDSDKFFNDVDDCRATLGINNYSYKVAVQPNDEDSLQSILKNLIRAFKNRAPALGERFERVVEKNERVASAAIAFLVTEYLYLDRSASYHEREQRTRIFGSRCSNRITTPFISLRSMLFGVMQPRWPELNWLTTSRP